MTDLLGGLVPATFLRRHWQKRPLLVRQAVPGFGGIVGRDEFLALATREDATSRLVIDRGRGKWERHDGPFGALDASMLPKDRWTVLVHGIESLVPGGWELLREFSFVPAARVDDLMVSYAADGGSVGPHDDRYDVFLLQGPGRRRWRISAQKDREIDPRAGIRVLRDFRAEEEWLLEPGDMLYLPPGVAHWGVAEGACFTYSIGFLAPSHAELVREFAAYLAAKMDGDALYEDPDLGVAKDSLEIDDAMIGRVGKIVGKRPKVGREDLAEFVGRFFTRPRARFAPQTIDRSSLKKARISLALPSRGLVRRGRIFLNGEAFDGHKSTIELATRLVRDRSLEVPVRASAEAIDLLHHWATAGWLHIS
jgi:50S ribosomal protein L16 3-hydroxylase